MERIRLRDLRNRASGIVRRARAGERLIITIEGVPAAEIGPISDEAAASRIEQLIPTGPRPRSDSSLNAEAAKALISFRRGHRLEGVAIRDLIDDGRNW